MNIGAWSVPVSWGFIAIHLVNYVPTNTPSTYPGFSDGKILAWSYGVGHTSPDVKVIGMNDLENPANFITLPPLRRFSGSNRRRLHRHPLQCINAQSGRIRTGKIMTGLPPSTWKQ